MIRVAPLLAMLIAACPGCQTGIMPPAASSALATADSYEVFSLRPAEFEREPATGPTFHGNPILGSAQITDRATRAKLNAALQRGARDNQTVAGCFNPRHGIRVTHGAVTTDFVICFECRQVEVWRNGTKIAAFLTSDSPEAVFDEVLRKAGVPLDNANASR